MTSIEFKDLQSAFILIANHQITVDDKRQWTSELPLIIKPLRTDFTQGNAIIVENLTHTASLCKKQRIFVMNGKRRLNTRNAEGRFKGSGGQPKIK